MNLRFQQLNLLRFKGFIEPQELQLNVAPGLHFVRGVNEVEPRLGSNGSGKSSLWDALCWVLFGKTVDGLRNPDIRPWRGRGTTMVQLQLGVDGATQVIERTAEPNGLTVNGDAATNDTVERLIGLSFEVFTNTVLLGQGQPLFFDLPPAGKMQMFIDVLELDKWEQRSAQASKTVGLLDQDAATAQGELTGAENGLSQVDELTKRSERDAQEWETQRRQQLADYEATYTRLEGDLALIEPKLAKALLAHDSAGTELKAIRQEQTNQADALRRLQHEHDRLTHQAETAQHEVERLEQQLKSMKATGRCPLCNQPLKAAHTHEKQLTEQLVDAKRQFKDRAVLQALTQRISETERLLSQLTKDEARFDAAADDALHNVNLYQPDAIAKRQKLQDLGAALAEAEQEANPHRNQLATLKRQRSKLTDEISQLKHELKAIAQRRERTQFWVKGFKDVRLYIVEQVLQELELATSVVMSDLGLGDWQVSYAVEKETKSGSVSRGLNVTVLSPANREPVRWEAWSGGEGQRLRIAGALALSEVLLGYAGVSVDTEVLDEPTAHLSGEGVRDLCYALAERAEAQAKRIWYVDHMSVQSARFASMTTVVKKPGGSIIEDEGRG